MVGAFGSLYKRIVKSFCALSGAGKLGFLAAFVAVVTVVLFAISNLWLTSSWGCKSIADQLEVRTGLNWEIGSVKWSPWNGVTVRDVEVKQPKELQKLLDEPLLSVAKMQVKPYWRQILKGKLEPRYVEADQPNISVSAEMLIAIAQKYNAPLETPKPKKEVVKKPSQPRPEKQSEKNEPKPQAKPRVNPKATKKPIQNKEETKRLPAALPVWLKIIDAQLRIVSASKQLELLHISGVSIETPVFGEDADGVLKIAEVKAFDQLVMESIEEKLKWRRPFLEVQDDQMDLFGLVTNLQGRVAIRKDKAKAAIFQLGVHIKPQPLRQQPILEKLAMDLDADQVAAQLSVGGGIFNPLSWRGSALGAAENFHVKERHGGHSIEFSELYAPAVFGSGQLRWSGLRLVGEDISILGNGGLSSSGEVLAVTRLVASPEMAHALNGAMLGAMIPGVTHSWWANLDTPDRKVRDVVLSGSLGNPMVDMTRKHEPLPLWQVVSKTMEFIQSEMREAGKVLQPDANHEMLKSSVE